MGSKGIPVERERVQGRWLVGIVGTVIGVSCLLPVGLSMPPHEPGRVALTDVVLSLTFGLIVWGLKAATPMAAVVGAMICLVVTLGSQDFSSPLRSGLSPLLALFVLTFAASRVGRSRKERLHLAESRKGRSAAQVVANLGVAGLCGGYMSIDMRWGTPVSVLMLAALCEATADTVSSEIGQAFGGTPWMVTTMRRVAVGTDGGVSALGSVAGVLGAGVVAGVGMWGLRLGWRGAGVAAGAGVAGLVFDSVLGATVERRGWLGNDLVNFCSTGFAVGVAWGVMWLG